MTATFAQLKAFDKSNHRLNAVVETPKGSRVKYAFDTKTGLLHLSKALPAGMVFPFNFGFIPQTRAQDGDPVDILVLNEEPLVCGCVLSVRVMAVIKLEQMEKNGWVRNDRIVGEAIGKETPEEFRHLKLEKRMVSQIEFFFKSYNKLYGKRIRILGTAGPRKAEELVRAAGKLHRLKSKSP